MEIIQPQFTKILANLLGAEGPVFTTNGNFYMVAPEVEKEDKPAGQILKVDFQEVKESLLCAPVVDGYGGIPAGIQADRDGSLWVADMRLGLLHVQQDGSFTQVAICDNTGETLQGCNDLSFDYDGNLWITAPAGKIAPHPYTRSMEEPFGSVYCYTKDKRLIKVASEIYFPNGIAVKHMPDGRPSVLLVAETPTKLIWAFDIISPGKVQNKRQWGKLPGEKGQGPDGMDFDFDGNLLVAHWGSSHIEVFGPDGGDPKYRIKCPFSKPSNLHFKQNSDEVFVTEHDSHALWKFQWKYQGRKEYCELIF